MDRKRRGRGRFGANAGARNILQVAVAAGLAGISLTLVVPAPAGASSSGPAPTPIAGIARPGGTYIPISPVRICDTRQVSVSSDVLSNQCNAGGPGPVIAGSTRSIGVAGYVPPGASSAPVPASATAAVLNVTVTDTTARGYLTIYPAGASRPLASDLNWAPGQTVSNLVTIAIGASGGVSFFSGAGAADIIVDAEGYYVPATASTPQGSYVPVAPTRICDTRMPNSSGDVISNQCDSSGAGTLGTGGTRKVDVAGYEPPGASSAPVPASATAAVLNVTVTDTTAGGYLTIYPAGASRPLASDLNWAPGETVASRVVAALGSGGAIAIYNYAGSADVVVDLAGYFDGASASMTGGLFVAASPARICDTRMPNSSGDVISNQCDSSGAGALGTGSTRNIQVSGIPQDSVPASATAVVLNVTVTDTTAGGYLTIYPVGGSRPLASDLNWSAGVTRANLVVAKLGSSGALSLYNYAGSTDVVVDVEGWYVPAVTSLDISVSNLPSGTPASIQVSGPNGYSKQLSASQDLTGIAPGSYTITPASISSGDATYYPSTYSTTVSLSTGEASFVSVDYADIVPATTKVIPPSEVLSLSGSPGGTQTLTLSSSASAIAAGDVLASGPSSDAPEGFLVSVRSVTTGSNGDVVATVTAATLSQAMTRGAIDLTAVLSAPSQAAAISRATSADWHLSEASQGATGVGQPRTSWSGGSAPLTCSTSASVSVTPSVTFTPTLNLSTTWGGFFNTNLTSASFTVTLAEKASLDAIAQAGAKCGTSGSGIPLGGPITLPSVDFVAGLVPVDITPVLQLYLQGSAGITAKVSASVTQTATLTAGVDYSNGSYSPVSGATNSFSQSFSADGDATASIGLMAKTSFLLYDLVGPTLDVGAKLVFNANTSKTPWWTLNGCLFGGIGFSFPLLDLNYSDSNLLQICSVLLQASSPPQMPANTATPTITDTQGHNPPEVNDSLVASTGTWTNNPTSYSYQWQLCASAGSCTDIQGATSSSYSVASSDEGDSIDVVVTASNAKGSGIATSAPTAPVASTSPTGTQGWTSQSYPSGLGLSNGELIDVACPSTGNCFAVGSGADGTTSQAVILATTNGGATWTSQSYPSGLGLSDGELVSISCPTISVCFVVGWGNKSSTDGAVILATTNGGATWTSQSYPSGLGLSSGFLQGLACPSSSSCFAVGAGGSGAVILATTNGGATWTSQSYPSGLGLSSGQLIDVACASSSSCFAVGAGGSGAVILVTTNGGATWTSQSYPSGLGLSSGVLIGLACPSSSSCFAVGGGGSGAVILATTNGGATWTSQSYPSGLGLSSGFLNGLACPSSSSCFAVGPENDATSSSSSGPAVILATTDGGR